MRRRAVFRVIVSKLENRKHYFSSQKLPSRIPKKVMRLDKQELEYKKNLIALRTTWVIRFLQLCTMGSRPQNHTKPNHEQQNIICITLYFRLSRCHSFCTIYRVTAILQLHLKRKIHNPALNSSKFIAKSSRFLLSWRFHNIIIAKCSISIDLKEFGSSINENPPPTERVMLPTHETKSRIDEIIWYNIGLLAHVAPKSSQSKNCCTRAVTRSIFG